MLVGVGRGGSLTNPHCRGQGAEGQRDQTGISVLLQESLLSPYLPECAKQQRPGITAHSHCSSCEGLL